MSAKNDTFSYATENLREELSGELPFRLSGLIFLLSSLLIVFLVERPYHPEELGLLDAPYLFAKTGQLANPAYEHLGAGNWDRMYTHPPIHYLSLGLLWKVFPLQYVLGIPPVLFFALVLYFLFSSKISTVMKLSVPPAIFCLMCVCLSDHVNFTLRPEMTLTIGWLCGIMALEKSRSLNWHLPSLFMGSMIITLSATYHYWAFPAVSSVLVYYWLIWRDSSLQQLKLRWLVLSLGGLFIGIPFIAAFIVPFFSEIYEMSSASEPMYDHLAQTPWNNFSIHAETYDRIYGEVRGNLIPGFLHHLYLPIGFISCLILFFSRKSHRTFAVAALSFIFVLTFVVKNKKAYYIFPEWLIFYLLIFALCFGLIQWVTKTATLKRFRPFLYLTFSLCSSVLITFNTKAKSIFEQPYVSALHLNEVSRKMSQKQIGANALIGGMIETWQISGARYWYCVENDLMSVPPENLETHLSNTDYFAAYEIGEDWSMTIPELYACGLLNLSGLSFGPNGVAFALFSAVDKREQPFVVEIDRLQSTEYSPSDSGKLKMVEMRCSEKPGYEKFEQTQSLSLSTDLSITESDQHIVFVLGQIHETEVVIQNLISNCTVHSATLMQGTNINNSALFLMEPKYDDRVDFYRTQKQALIELEK